MYRIPDEIVSSLTNRSIFKILTTLHKTKGVCENTDINQFKINGHGNMNNSLKMSCHQVPKINLPICCDKFQGTTTHVDNIFTNGTDCDFSDQLIYTMCKTTLKKICGMYI